MTGTAAAKEALAPKFDCPARSGQHNKKVETIMSRHFFLAAQGARESGGASPRSILEAVAATLGEAVAQVQRGMAERKLRHELAAMSDSMLLDIGIAPDEIIRIRAGERFTPRGWQRRACGQDACGV